MQCTTINNPALLSLKCTEVLGGGAVKSTGGNLLPPVIGVASCNQLIELSPTCAAKAKAQPCPAGSRVELEGMLALQMELMSETFCYS